MVQPLSEYEAATDPVVDHDREAFRITDDAQATWAMRKLRAIRAKVEENRRIAADEKARIEEWLERANSSLVDDAAYFEGILILYARQEREANDRKTITTPFGAVKSRAGQQRWQINADEFLPWARVNAPDCIRVKEEAALSEVKAKFTAIPGIELALAPVTEDGEVVPGVLVIPSETSYTVEVDL